MLIARAQAPAFRANDVAKAAKINLEIQQGRTFLKTLRWGEPRRQYRQIQAATQAAPCVLTVTGHGMPDEWAFRISNCKGMTELNADRYYQATVVDEDHIELNEVISSGFRAYQGGGIIAYNSPVNLDGYTAKMQVRKRVESTEVLIELSTDNGRIVLDDESKTINLQITALDTAEIAWTSGVYDLELTATGGKVELLAFGNVQVTREVTR